ncbi:MAG: hypothetical protein N2450_00680 [bacterium]|nr:hypothetical protein [bacterium]
MKTRWYFFGICFLFQVFGVLSYSKEILEKKSPESKDTAKTIQLIDTVRLDTRPRVKTRANTLLNRDTILKVPYSFTVFTQDSLPFQNRFSSIEIAPTHERSMVDASHHLVGIFPYDLGVYGQPSVLANPIDPHQIQWIAFERENNDPIHFRTSSELISVRGLNYACYSLFEDANNVIYAEPLIYNPKHPLLKVDYRNGYYALGRADVRFFQPISEATRWGFATTVSQGDGRYLGADVNETNLFFHYRYLPKDKIHWFLNVRQNQEKNGVAFRSARDRSEQRYDLDLAIRSPQRYLDLDSTSTTSSDNFFVHQVFRWRFNFFWTVVERRWFRNPYAVGRRLGAKGRITLPTTFGSFSFINSYQTLSALLPNRGKHPFHLNEACLQYERDAPFRFTLANHLWISKQYQPKYTFSLNTSFAWFSNLESTVSFSQNIRYPSFEERYSWISEPILERSFDKVLYLQNPNVPYIGNPNLSPVLSNQLAFATHWYKNHHLKIHLYSAWINTLHSIQTQYVLDTSATGYFTAIQSSSVQNYKVFGTQWTSKIDEKFFFNGTISSVLDPNRKNTFVPDVWGFVDFGFQDAFQGDAADWQGRIRIRHIGERYWYNDHRPTIHPRVTPIDLLFSIRIYSLRINWGISNFARETYEVLPGYPCMHREEVWGVNWNLWD